jgi:site-specific recombinase XerD
MTELIYISRIASYCFNIGKNPDELIALKLEGLQNPASTKEFQAEELLENFLRQDKYLKTDKDGNKEEVPFTENSKIGMLAAVKSFYQSTRGRSLTDDTGEFIEVPEAKKRAPKVEELLELENAMKCNRDKFLVWFLESCPLRKGTLTMLKFGDLKQLNDKDVPYWFKVEAKRLKGSGKGKYRKAKHIGFLHYYAVEKFEAYKQELKEKGIEYNDNTPLFVSYKSTKVGSKKGDKMTNIFAIFVDASAKAFKGEKRFSPHDLRDVFSTILMNPKVKANTNLTKPLTSHVPTGIEAVYENPDDSEDTPNSDLLAVFKMCLPFLVPETIPELKVELNEQKTENQATKKELTDLKKKLDKYYEMVIENFRLQPESEPITEERLLNQDNGIPKKK